MNLGDRRFLLEFSVGGTSGAFVSSDKALASADDIDPALRAAINLVTMEVVASAPIDGTSQRPTLETPTVIIESPFRGESGSDAEYARNVRYLDRCILDSLNRGEAPFASHGFYPRVLDDRKSDEREKGIRAGWAFRRLASKRVFYTDHGWSSGMVRAREIYFAECLSYEERSIGAEPWRCYLCDAIAPEENVFAGKNLCPAHMPDLGDPADHEVTLREFEKRYIQESFAREDIRESAIREFSGLISHGDEKHRAWLAEAAERYIYGERALLPDDRATAETLRPEAPTPLTCTCDTRDAQAPMHAVDCELRENYDPEDICPECGALLEPGTGPGPCTVCRRAEQRTLDESKVPALVFPEPPPPEPPAPCEEEAYRQFQLGKAPCKHPARVKHGRHEWYADSDGDMYCRACGGRGKLASALGVRR